MLLYGSIAFPAMGTLAVWLYAAIQPSYGRGPVSRGNRGVAIWMMTMLVDGAWASLGILSLRLFVIMKMTDPLAIILETIAGASLYQRVSRGPAA